jgi:hypothetical protein
MLFVSVPFTWNLPQIRSYLKMGAPSWDMAMVGGPAVKLMPGYLGDLPNTLEGDACDGVLQRVNLEATRTTTGCIRRCKFCGIGTGKIEGKFEELPDWPDLPLICDNNLLASSGAHFDKVMDRLEAHRGVDFNQGLDARLLDTYHAKRFARLKSPKIRLALDNIQDQLLWEGAVDLLLLGGVKRSWISSYALVGFDSDPGEAWHRCGFIEAQKIKAYPMWFHSLDALRPNLVTEEQKAWGWTDRERKKLMQWFYQHRDHDKPRGKNQ